MSDFDVVVIGAGFGGMACALDLAERGARVALFERLTYPGGCASTFKRRGYRFEAGATLFSGFGEGQLFRQWIERYQMDVEFQPLDPVVELRTGDFQLGVAADRRRFIERFCALEGAPERKLRSFFAWQEKVADSLWELFDDPDLLPPLSPAALMRHVGRSPRYLRLLPIIGRTVESVLESRGLADFEPLRAYLDAVCQITVQASSREAEAPFAFGAMDYFFRGTGHIRGGIGELATALTETIERLGGEVYFADAARKFERRDGRWRVHSRRREVAADTVVANLLPHHVAMLLDEPTLADGDLVRLADRVEKGWGAAMWYLGVEDGPQLPDGAHHIEMVDELDQPFIEGNHIFCSIGGRDEPERAPDGQRTVTISTHVDMQKLRSLGDEEQGAYVDQIQQRMRATLAKRAPEVDEATVFEMSASPRTFERFTNRFAGYVGGIPRRAGLQNYRRIWPSPVAPDLYLVGDTAFPGQSTLAAALGGLRVSQKIWCGD